MKNIFYVYEHWRPDRGECFYVGKGKGGRANELRHNRNRFHKFIQAKLSRLGTAVEVRIISDCLSESEAFALERERNPTPAFASHCESVPPRQLEELGV